MTANITESEIETFAIELFEQRQVRGPPAINPEKRYYISGLTESF